jgi:hypothetical protein
MRSARNPPEKGQTAGLWQGSGSTGSQTLSVASPGRGVRRRPAAKHVGLAVTGVTRGSNPDRPNRTLVRLDAEPERADQAYVRLPPPVLVRDDAGVALRDHQRPIDAAAVRVGWGVSGPGFRGLSAPGYFSRL